MILRGGPGIRVRQIGDRFTARAVQYVSLDHPWRCLADSNGVTIQRGLVNGHEPYINGRLMSGFTQDGRLDNQGVPVLALPSGNYPLWICIRVVVDRNGKLPDKNVNAATLSIVTSLLKVSRDPLVGLHPIAVVRLEEGAPAIYQIGKFDYQHYTVAEKGKKIRHYFEVA